MSKKICRLLQFGFDVLQKRTWSDNSLRHHQKRVVFKCPQVDFRSDFAAEETHHNVGGQQAGPLRQQRSEQGTGRVSGTAVGHRICGNIGQNYGERDECVRQPRGLVRGVQSVRLRQSTHQLCSDRQTQKHIQTHMLILLISYHYCQITSSCKN